MMQDELGENNPERHYVGLRSSGESKKGFNHWLELIHYRAEDGDDKARGYGADAGIFYRFDAPLNPHLIIGYALGTGDGNNTNDTDHTFRQTGFNDNNGRTGGVNRYKDMDM